MACSMSSASAPRTSPTRIRSGRMRKLFLTRSRCVSSPRPSLFAGRVSIRATCGCWRMSSAESSIVTIRSSDGIDFDSAFSKVVFPAPVPPEIMKLMRDATAACKNSAICGESEPLFNRLAICRCSTPKRRIESLGPSKASGGTTALTRDPSGSRASTSGETSSMRRPTRPTMRWIMRSRWSSSAKMMFVVSRRPCRSTKTSSALFTRMSLTVGSSINVSRGPRPKTSAARSCSSRSRTGCSKPSFRRSTICSDNFRTS